MLRGTDFILNPDKLEDQFQVVEVSAWNDFNTKEKLGLYYTVLLPKLKFEKVRVGVRSDKPIISAEELERQGQIPVVFEGLRTWASTYKGSLSVKAEATGVKRISAK